MYDISFVLCLNHVSLPLGWGGELSLISILKYCVEHDCIRLSFCHLYRLLLKSCNKRGYSQYLLRYIIIIIALLHLSHFSFSFFHTGFFIFLSFALSRRVLELYRSKLTGILRHLTIKKEADSSRQCSMQSTCNTDTLDTQDTRLWITNRSVVQCVASIHIV